jgi:predicted metal-dependent peptidase
MTTKTPDAEVLKKLTKARATLIIDQPFFGTLALRLKLVPMPDELEAMQKARGMKPTLAVDGEHIYYCEDFIRDLDLPLVKSALAHEVGHCVFDHIGRRGHRDPTGWNMAGDYVINDMLKDAGFPLGEGWLWNAAYKGMSADQIYNQLPKNPQGGQGQGQGKGNSQGGNQPLCDILDGKQDPADKAMQQNDWKVATIQAANAAKQQGKLPGSLARFVEEMTASKVDWRDKLRRFITERAKDEYNWHRPNRRYLSAGLYLPSLYSEHLGTIVVVTDDSGSIGDDMLKAFASEIGAIRDSTLPKKTIHISCDARVNHVAEFEQHDEFKLVSKGGGGTDFRPPFDWLDKRGIKPACLVYLTDMYGSFPQQAPDYPVLWCATTGQVGPWGETVKIEL